MGKGIKAGKKRQQRMNRETIKLMEESYDKGYQDGIYSSVDKSYRLIVGLVIVGLVKEFGFSPEDTEKLSSFMDELSIKLENGEITVEELREYLIDEGIMFKKFIEEDEIMSGKARYSDNAYIDLIERGIDNKGIFKELGIPTGSQTRVGKHIDKLRKTHGALEVNTKFNLRLYDTVTKQGVWHRVTEIREDDFEVMTTQGKKQTETVLKADYISGKSGFIKRNLPEVKSYIDESLKKKPAVSNPEFEAAVKDMFQPKNVQEVTEVTTIIDDEIDSAYKFDGTVNASCETSTVFLRQAELSFKADMNAYSNKVSKLKDKMEHGEIIDLTDVTEYNKITDKYRGVYANEAAIATM